MLLEAEEMKHVAHHAAIVDQEIEKLAKNLPQRELDDDESSQEWMHILATIDTCALPSVTQFCDKDGYDIVPIRMIIFVNDPNLEHRGKPKRVAILLKIKNTAVRFYV